MSRSRLNILITGTPGTGKTTLSELLSTKINYNLINVGNLIKEKSLHGDYIPELDTYELDEDKINDELEILLSNDGGNIVDFHTCEIFPQRWFDLVIVLRTSNDILYPRLEARGYNALKISENIECEIMQVVADEARESYDESIVFELENNSIDDMNKNLEHIVQLINKINVIRG